ncbi:MAG TPA: hypothetical protein VGC18_07080 [Lacisediminihabitans sp.]|uniref:BPSS1187 family protein n=1 Tax=Lacisediminihabitans sp. TaxID=2787631 RepID=UPI002EDB0859
MLGSRIGRRGALRSAALVALLVVGAGLAQQAGAPATASASEPRDPSPALIRFRLPSESGRPLSPNSFNYAQHATRRGPLLLFLPATRAQPGNYRAFLAAASSLGYHVLALDYWNRGRSVTRTCTTDASCYTSVQRNRFDGSDPTRFSDVDPANSVLSRLRDALDYLRGHDSDGGWSRYSTGPHIHWSRIVLAGHSQGGGESAYIAHRHRAHGVLMFSSPVDTDSGIAASWMHRRGATPPTAMYGLVNSHDMYFEKIVGSWTELGMGQRKETSDAAMLTGSHELISSSVIGTPAQSHDRSVSDRSPVGADGLPMYRSAWIWMLRQVR